MRSIRSFPILLTGFLIISALAGVVRGQFYEDFESATPSWQRRESDCLVAQSKWRQRRSNEIQTKNRFEKIHLRNGPGTQILVSHDIDPAFVIPELVPSVRIKASRPGIAVFVRVVLPHTPAPNGIGPMTTLLLGPIYRATGKWETLSFKANKTDLQRQLQEEIWMLRQKFGPHVQQRDAYIDKVVLNLYTGPGETDVQIDDLRVGGIVAADRIAERVSTIGRIKHDTAVQPASAGRETDKQKSLVVRDGTVLLVKKKPFFPRIIQHNGESFEYLKAIGFNTIELKSTATYEQLKNANQLDIWLICPAPSSAGLSPIGFQFDRVLAWTIGEKITGRNLRIVQQQIREIRESDLREGRPIIGHAISHWSQLAQLTDVLGVGVQPIGTSFLASQYSDWIKQRSVAIGNRKPIWADIQTQLSPSIVAQIGTLATQVPPVPIEPQQVKFLVYEAISGGARGLRFRSHSRLDAPDPASRLRAMTIEWVNAELVQIEPWAVGGVVTGEISTGDNHLEITVIKTNRSRLLLVQRPTHHEQYLAGDVPIKTITFQDAAATYTDRVYLISESGLDLLPNSRTHTGNQIRIENCPYTAAVVLTQDPLVVNNLTQSYKRVGKQSIVQLHSELTQQWLAIMQLIDSQMGRMGRSSAAASGALNEAVAAFRMAQSMIDRNSPQMAVPFLHRADERLAFARREMVTGPLGMFQSKTSTPFATHCSLIPLFWELAARLSENQWNPNGLAGGDFEDLEFMMASGWQNRRITDPMLTTIVKLEDSAAIDGQFSLKLSVSASSTIPELVEATPLRITTPPIQVKGGQLVRIHGWVNVPNVIRGSHDGLTITDSLGGPDLAERIPITSGWQEFTLYRGVPAEGTMTVTFALNGLGEAMIDEVTIQTIDLPPAIPRQARNQ